MDQRTINREANAELSHFERQYIESMLWSTIVEPFGECSCCGEQKPLRYLDCDREPVCEECKEANPDCEFTNSDSPADDHYFASDLSPESIERIKRDCARFLELAGELADESNYIGTANPDNIAAHDFWLTRNHHGAGFWDGDWETGDELTAISEQFGEQYLIVGDDGKLHLEGGKDV